MTFKLKPFSVSFNGCLLFFLLHGFIFAQTLKSIHALRIEDSPVIDGNLEETAWSKAAWQTGFVLLSNGEEAKVQTRFKVIHDERNIYFAVEALEPQIEEIKAAVSEADGNVFLDDCIEIFLDPNRYQTEYFHLIINSLGTVNDAKFTQLGHYRDKSWNSEAQVKTKKLADRWQAEIAIPLGHLELTQKSLDGWTFNLGRERYAGGFQELSSFSNLQAFTQPDKFYPLLLEKSSHTRFFWEFSEITSAHVIQDQGALFYTANLMITNKSGKLRLVWLNAGIESKDAGLMNSPATGILFNQGETIRTTIKIPVPSQGDGVLKLSLSSGKDNQDILALKTLPVHIAFNAIQMTLTTPPYRNSIYSTQNITRIAGEVLLALQEQSLSGSLLDFQLLKDDGKVTVARKQISVTSAKTQFDIPVAALSEGDYVLRVALKNTASGQDIHSDSVVIRKLPPPSSGNEVWFDENGACHVNGTPFLPFGFFHHFTGKPLHDSFTVAHLYLYMTKEILDTLHAAGQYVVAQPFLSVGDFNRAAPRYNPDKLYTPQELEIIRKAVKELSGHPALLAWYLEDEPEGRRILAEKMKQAYELIRATDPYHPVIVLDDTIRGQEKYAHCADILMPDPYPGFIRGALSARGIDMITTFVKAAVNATSGRKPVWLTPQWFSWWDNRFEAVPHHRGADFRELRNMNYQAVIHGAKGFIGFSGIGWRHYADFRLGLPFLAEEMQILRGAILAGDIADSLTIDPGVAGDKFFCSLRKYNGSRYLFAVNASTGSTSINVAFKEKFNGTLHVVSENCSVKVIDGKFTDDFDVYESRIYTDNQAVAETMDLNRMKKEIAALKEKIGAVHKKGNIAYWETGTKASASSQRWLRQPVHAIDGINSCEPGGDNISYIFWEANTSDKPDWLLLEFPEKRTVGRVVIHTPNIKDLSVQIKKQDGWENVLEVKNQSGDRIEFSLLEPMETDHFRVCITATRDAADRSIIYELELYDK